VLTDKRIQATIRTATAEVTLKDSDGTRGAGMLALRVRPGTGGTRATWMATWKRDGKRGSKALGNYPELSLAEAREKFADEVRPLIQAGKAPSEVASGEKGATVEALALAYIESLRTNGKTKADEYQRTLLTGKYPVCGLLGLNRLAKDIEPDDVARALKMTDLRGARRQADVERTILVAMFNYGIRSTHDYRAKSRRDWGIKVNPAAVIPRDTGAVVARERNLSAEELKAVWDNAPDQTGDVLRLIIACGQRVFETIQADGKDVDLESALWTMPAAKTKMKARPHYVPLPPQAVEIFRRLKELHGDGPLFPARAGAKGVRIGIPSVSRGASRMSCCDPFQPRDLRRSWKSRAGDAGVDRFTRDLIQQHARNDTGSKFYDHADYLPQMREAMQKWSEWLAKALAGKQLQELEAA
jgi:integrase